MVLERFESLLSFFLDSLIGLLMDFAEVAGMGFDVEGWVNISFCNSSARWKSLCSSNSSARNWFSHLSHVTNLPFTRFFSFNACWIFRCIWRGKRAIVSSSTSFKLGKSSWIENGSLLSQDDSPTPTTGWRVCCFFTWRLAKKPVLKVALVWSAFLFSSIVISMFALGSLESKRVLHLESYYILIYINYSRNAAALQKSILHESPYVNCAVTSLSDVNCEVISLSTVEDGAISSLIAWWLLRVQVVPVAISSIDSESEDKISMSLFPLLDASSAVWIEGTMVSFLLKKLSILVFPFEDCKQKKSQVIIILRLFVT